MLLSAPLHKIGDIVRVERGSEAPADLLLLQSSVEDGACFVSTMNLDGETSLKGAHGQVAVVVAAVTVAGGACCLTHLPLTKNTLARPIVKRTVGGPRDRLRWVLRNSAQPLSSCISYTILGPPSLWRTHQHVSAGVLIAHSTRIRGSRVVCPAPSLNLGVCDGYIDFSPASQEACSDMAPRGGGDRHSISDDNDTGRDGQSEVLQETSVLLEAGLVRSIAESERAKERKWRKM